LTNLDRVATEIKSVGLYDLIYQDIQKELNSNNPSISDIKKLLLTKSSFLQEYKDTNLEYNLSNIHLNEIDTKDLNEECKKEAEIFNANLKQLQENEKYTLDFQKSSVLTIIFSVEFFVLFSVQYFIVLLSLKEYQFLIYSIFLASILVAWQYAKYQKRVYDKKSKEFYTLYDDSLILLTKLEQNGCIDKESLWIKESDEHV
jgi:hypothetical protein